MTTLPVADNPPKRAGPDRMTGFKSSHASHPPRHLPTIALPTADAYAAHNARLVGLADHRADSTDAARTGLANYRPRTLIGERASPCAFTSAAKHLSPVKADQRYRQNLGSYRSHKHHRGVVGHADAVDLDDLVSPPSHHAQKRLGVAYHGLVRRRR
jgi:hypothetical protein